MRDYVLVAQLINSGQMGFKNSGICSLSRVCADRPLRHAQTVAPLAPWTASTPPTQPTRWPYRCVYPHLFAPLLPVVLASVKRRRDTLPRDQVLLNLTPNFKKFSLRRSPNFVNGTRLPDECVPPLPPPPPLAAGKETNTGELPRVAS